jgi:hypothetical protein
LPAGRIGEVYKGRPPFSASGNYNIHEFEYAFFELISRLNEIILKQISRTFPRIRTLRLYLEKRTEYEALSG